MPDQPPTAPTGAELPGPFGVYEDYEGGLHICDGTTRIVLTDNYAYDKTDEDRRARMQRIADALTTALATVEPARGDELARAMAPIAKDSPLWQAWEAYQKTEEYANTKRWALHPTHVDGSLWAAFSIGYNLATERQAATQRETATLTERDRWCRRELARYLMEHGRVDDPRVSDLGQVPLVDAIAGGAEMFRARARDLTDEEVEAAIDTALRSAAGGKDK